MSETPTPEQLERFRNILRDVRPHTHDGSALLAALGMLLHRVNPSFNPTDLGATRLVELLYLVPDVGRVEAAQNGHLRFIFTGDVTSVLQTTGVAEQHLSPAMRLLPLVWKLVTAFRPPVGGSWFDLRGIARADYGSLSLPDYRNFLIGFRVVVSSPIL